MDYFYCPPQQIDSHQVVIDEEEFSHLVHVMRKKVGDEIFVVDGVGTAYDVVLTDIRRKTAVGRIREKHPGHNEPGLSLTLAVGILKNPSKFDFLVEKITELGVREIIPLRTERSIPSHARVDRWQKLALAAMKQSGRSYLPLVSPLRDLEEFLAAERSVGVRLVALETMRGGGPAGVPVVGDAGSAIGLIGPEGGFTDEEAGRCLGAGYQPVTLGVRRLRTETAAIVLASLLLLGAPRAPETGSSPDR